MADRDVEGGDHPKWLGTINLEFPDHATTATPLNWNYQADCVLLKCDDPPASKPLPLQALTRSGGDWETFGFVNMESLDGLAISGDVSNHSGELYGAPAIQLYSKQLAAGDGGDARGLSGGPVITSVRAVTEELNHQGIRAARGGAWHPTAVARLLSRLP